MLLFLLCYERRLFFFKMDYMFAEYIFYFLELLYLCHLDNNFRSHDNQQMFVKICPFFFLKILNKFFFLLKSFIAKSKVGNQNKKTSMLYLSHKQTSKDFQLKSQIAVSLQDNDLKNTKKIWLESRFFKDS